MQFTSKKNNKEDISNYLEEKNVNRSLITLKEIIKMKEDIEKSKIKSMKVLN